jgi:hypothetical protein
MSEFEQLVTPQNIEWDQPGTDGYKMRPDLSASVTGFLREYLSMDEQKRADSGLDTQDALSYTSSDRTGYAQLRDGAAVREVRARYRQGVLQELCARVGDSDDEFYLYEGALNYMRASTDPSSS